MTNYLNEITELEGFINLVKKERFDLAKTNNLEIQDILDSNFNYFKEVTIKVNSESATFHLVNEEGFNQEIFSLNFYERYKGNTNLEISYYSTSTQSDFELRRLILLGQVARILREKSEFILKSILDTKKKIEGRSNELYSTQFQYEKQISEYRRMNTENLKVKVEIALKSEEGIVLSTPKTIKLKRNYTPELNKIKIIKISGKTCTVAIEMNGGNIKGTESRVNIDDLIRQVSYYVSL